MPYPVAHLHGDLMRHFLAGFLNWAAPLVATLPAVLTVIVPSPSDLVPFLSGGEPSEADTILTSAQRPFAWIGMEGYPPSVLPTNHVGSKDLVVEEPNILPGGEPSEGAPRNPSSTPASATVASSDSEQPDAAAGAPPNAQECISTELTTYSKLGNISDPTCGGARRTLSQKLPKLAPICSKRRALDTP